MCCRHTEVDMGVRMVGPEAHLEGDWTISGVEENLESMLLSLKLLENSGARRINIDCRRINGADTSGLQLLNVWMLCARLRGIEPRLVNLTDNLKQAIHTLELRHCMNECGEDGISPTRC